MTRRLLAVLIVVTVLALLISACAAPETRVETRTSTNTVSVPAPVACFDPADLPRLPSKTVVDPAKATTDQLAAAAAADRENFMLYAQTVSELWAQCAKALKGVPK